VEAQFQIVIGKCIKSLRKSSILLCKELMESLKSMCIRMRNRKIVIHRIMVRLRLRLRIRRRRRIIGIRSRLVMVLLRKRRIYIMRRIRNLVKIKII
jgi:hypothetical protein